MLTAEAKPTGTRALEAGDELVPGLYAWQLLGAGRRFETWLAWSSSLWSHVTVKLPRPHCNDESTQRALVNEATTAGALSHPSIQRLLQDRTDEALPSVVYEYVEGPPLDAILAEQGAFAPGDVVRLGMQLAAALHYLHGRGIVHMDLKPSNIVVREGRAVLLDFDIARPIGTHSSGRKPRGSPPFMAPEQIRCEPSAPSMDLYALGAILYEAAANVPAFEPHEEHGERVYPQLDGPPVALRTIAPTVPPPLEAAILRLLDLEPHSRPHNAAAVLSLLEGALDAGEERLWPAWADDLLAA
jgi:serine/threonine protein kinase